MLWPQDTIYLAWLLVLAALALFLLTAVAGRLFCGFACPQTVYSQIFMWIENRIEGDWLHRLRSASGPLSVAAKVRKGVKHGLWLILSLWTGLTFVGYFTPVRELLADVLAGQAGAWEVFWLLSYAAFTYLLAGLLREQVCQQMCPYARFQGVMFDTDTLAVSYDAERGEPRGALRKALAAEKKGHCVDCAICVQVCPAGIDIRHGMQYQCIGCGLCIDACDAVMDKLQWPRGLIAFAAAKPAAWPGRLAWRRLWARPRVLIYTGLLLAVSSGALVLLLQRIPLQMDVSRDRGALLRQLADGRIENSYRLHLMNMAEQPRRFVLQTQGLAGAELLAAAADQPSEHGMLIELAAGAHRTVSLSVRASGQSEPGRHGGANPFLFSLRALDAAGGKVQAASVFMVP